MDTLTPLELVTFIVIRVSNEKREMENTRKDGTKFSTFKWALTLMPTNHSGFGRGLQYTMWTESDQVADWARALTEVDGDVLLADGTHIRDPRLAILNHKRDFACGAIRVNDKVDAEGNKYPDGQTVWTVDGVMLEFGVTQLPVSKDAGNIRQIAKLASAMGFGPSKAKVAVGVTANTTVETGNAPF